MIKCYCFLQVYSQSNCNLECSLDYAYRNVEKKKAGFMACVPWFYPTDDERNARICSPWEAKAFQVLKVEVWIRPIILTVYLFKTD